MEKMVDLNQLVHQEIIVENQQWHQIAVLK